MSCESHFRSGLDSLATNWTAAFVTESAFCIGDWHSFQVRWLGGDPQHIPAVGMTFDARRDQAEIREGCAFEILLIAERGQLASLPAKLSAKMFVGRIVVSHPFVCLADFHEFLTTLFVEFRKLVNASFE